MPQTDYDAIVFGSGQNGLATTSTIAIVVVYVLSN